MVYIKLFQTEQEKQACTDKYEYLSYTIETDEVMMHEEVNYSKKYLTFVAKSNGIFSFSGTPNNIIQYSIDNGSTWSEATQTPTINVNSGDKVLWKGTMTPYNDYRRGVGTFSASTASFDIEGNAMSLLYGDNFANQNGLTGKDAAFYCLFSNTKCVNAQNLSLQATTLSSSCYRCMFSGCTSLTTAPELLATTMVTSAYTSMFASCTSLAQAPELPATTLADSCYNGMFNGCTSLTIAPELPATTLTNSCYYQMFYGCTSLTQAPELPTKTLAIGCYYFMFFNCTKLNLIKMLATNISAEQCLGNWVNGVAASGTFVKAASMTTLPSGVSGIPNGWSVQNV